MSVDASTNAGNGSDGTVIGLSDVEFSYGRRAVLNELSLSVSKGTIFGLLGSNGAGKTTLIRLLVGLGKPQSGTVTVLGQSLSPQLSQQIGYMPQLNALYSELSVQENLDFFARMYGLNSRAERREAVESGLSVVGLLERRGDPVLWLSGGMRQRLSLACALVHSPEVLLLDEPTVGLDPELRASFWEHFQSLSEAGTTIMISSHTMDDAAHCHRLAFLHGGRTIAQDTPEGLCAATGVPNASLDDAFLFFVRGG